MELLKNLEGMSADEQMTAVVELQKAAMKQLEEQKQVSIGKSAEMVIQGLKKIKSDFEAKFDSLNYDIQAKVANLKDGEQGIQGPKGDQGDRGLDGANGRDGRDGKDGRDGLDGADGVGVRDAKIDFDGSLVISLTDGREINCGEVVSVDVAKQIQKVTHNIQTGAGGDSQTVLDAIAAIQATIATYGTMATQNKTSVDIEGGTIDNTVIGGTTPAAGTFTTLTATGQTSLGGAAGSESFRATSVASAVNWIQAAGNTAGTGPILSATGSDTNVDFLYSAKGTAGSHVFRTNTTTRQFQVSHTASAVNYVQVTGAATGSGVAVSAQGSDSNVRFNLSSKGSGGLGLYTNNFATTGFNVANTASGVNYYQVASAVTGFGPVLSAQGTDTNIPLVLQPKGTGALQAQQTDSTATGGNARGANAVDWQTSRNAANQVSNGLYSVISGGVQNTSSSNYSVVSGGTGNTASGGASVVIGGQNNQATNTYAIAGGGGNQATGNYSIALGGYGITSAGFYSTIVGGQQNSATSGSAVTTQSATMNGTTAVTLSGSNANIKVGQYITGTYTAGLTYVAAISGTSLTLSQAASGSGTATLSFYTPHGVVVGGGNNQATGSYSFIGGGGDAGTAANRNVASGDWSFVGGGRANNIQSGSTGSVIAGGGDYGGGASGNTISSAASTISGGFANTITAYGSVIVGGAGNTANGQYSVVLGSYAATTRSIQGNVVIGSNAAFSGTQGTTQLGIIALNSQTTDATATVLRSNTSAASTTNQVILPNNSAYTFRGEIVSGVTGGGNSKSWTIEGLIKRGANAASTTLVGSTVTSMYADVGAATWTIALSADTTNGGLAVTFTGQASTTIRTVCQIRTTEMTF